jgi:hypothetical protein
VLGKETNLLLVWLAVSVQVRRAVANLEALLGFSHVPRSASVGGFAVALQLQALLRQVLPSSAIRSQSRSSPELFRLRYQISGDQPSLQSIFRAG